ncbi:MAG TPA: hypothetical protein VKU02_13265 [Gemmataceae bacterium]|nr:hypothetical protein [Gemmataceae bacterium]
MQNTAWIALFRRIPTEQHNMLAVVTTVGIEINIQDLVRIEEDHLVIRGRLAGTTDNGRIFFLPYEQLSYLGFTKEMKDAQVRVLYGDTPPAGEPEPKTDISSVETVLAPPPVEAAPVPADPSKPEPPAAPVEMPSPSPFMKIPRKSGVLERLRARAQLSKTSTPPPNP